MFTLISRIFQWLFKTRRRALAIYDGVVLFARATESLYPRALPKYLLAFTDNHSDSDDDLGFDSDNPCDMLVSCEKCDLL